MTTLFFDFDGTLIDSAPGILDSFRRVLAAAAVSPAVAIDSRLIGPPLGPTMARLTGERDPQRLATLVQAFKDTYDSEGYKATQAYPGLQATLATLAAAGHRLVLVTNKRRVPVEHILSWLGIAEFIRAIYTPDSWTPPLLSKVDTLQRALQENAAEADCLMVGDSIDDAQAAAANGVAFVAVSFGYGNAADQTEYPRLGTVASLLELVTLVEGHSRSASTAPK